MGLWGENTEAMEALRRRIEADPPGIGRYFSLLDEAECAMAGPEWKKKALIVLYG